MTTSAEAPALIARFLNPEHDRYLTADDIRSEFEPIAMTDNRAEPVLAAMLDMGDADAREEYREIAANGLFAKGPLVLCVVNYHDCNVVVTDGEHVFMNRRFNNGPDYWQLVS